MEILRYHVGEFLLEGPTAEYRARDLIEGFDTHIADKLNTGYQLRGQLRVYPKITPILNTVKGAYSEQQLTIGTGTGSVELGRVMDVGNMRHPYIWRGMYDGDIFTQVPWFNISLPRPESFERNSVLLDFHRNNASTPRFDPNLRSNFTY